MSILFDEQTRRQNRTLLPLATSRARMAVAYAVAEQRPRGGQSMMEERPCNGFE